MCSAFEHARGRLHQLIGRALPGLDISLIESYAVEPYQLLVPPQVLFLSPCMLVTPKRVLAGSLRLSPLQLHFVGDPPDEQPADPDPPRAGGSVPPDSAAASCGARTHRHWDLAAVVEVRSVGCSGSSTAFSVLQAPVL